MDKKKYIIKKVDNEGNIQGDCIESIPDIEVGVYPWDNSGYTPRTLAKVFYTDTHLHVCFRAYESEITVKCFDMNGAVCRDSCVEFFFNPKPDEDDRYLNFEINPVGNLHLGIGRDTASRELIGIEDHYALFDMHTSVKKETIEAYHGAFWEVRFSIPFSFIENFFGKLAFRSGYRFEGNFYKCGNGARWPHYGCWNQVQTKSPDFHRPEYFGELILE